MIILRVWRARLTEVPEFAFQNLSASLAPSLRSLIRPALEVQAGILGAALEVLRQSTQNPSALYADPRLQTIDGEVFTNGRSVFVVEIAPPDDDRTRRAALRLWEATRAADIGRRDQLASLQPPEWRLSFYYIGPCFDDPQLDQVEQEINNAFNVSLQAEPFESRRFKELREEGRARRRNQNPKSARHLAP